MYKPFKECTEQLVLGGIHFEFKTTTLQPILSVVCSLWISVWSISVGDFNSCGYGVCDCLHKTQA